MALWWTVVSTLLLVSTGEAARGDWAGDKERPSFIGWQGDTYKPADLPQLTLDEATQQVRHLAESDPKPPGEGGDKKPWVQVLSWRPRAFVYHHFLTDAEAAHIIKLAAPQMKRSTVVGENNKGVVNSIRTSAGCFLVRNQDEVLKAIDQRLAVWTGIPPSHQEDMQVLRYGPSNKYGAHLDGLGRVASVLIYLIPPEEGGETAFPESAGWVDPAMGEASQGPFSQCAKGHVAYKPKRGDALLFWDMDVDAKTQDPFSQHTGCPVIRGTKWNAVKWIHPKPFREADYNASLVNPPKPQADPGVCDNRHDMCETWAKQGECQKNPPYMMGDNTSQGMCRLACKACVPCKAGDDACIRKNREAQGYMSFDEAEIRLAEVGTEPGSVLKDISWSISTDKHKKT